MQLTFDDHAYDVDLHAIGNAFKGNMHVEHVVKDDDAN